MCTCGNCTTQQSLPSKAGHGQTFQCKEFTLIMQKSKGINKEMRLLCQRKEQLSTDQGCLLWGMRVAVPAKLKPRSLREYILHIQNEVIGS